MSKVPSYDFRKEAAIAINSGQSNAIILTGNTHGLFFLADDDIGEYVPLVDFLTAKWNIPGQILMVYEPDGRIRILDAAAPGKQNRNDDKPNREKIKDAWLQWKTGLTSTDLRIKEMLSAARLRSQAESMGDSFDALMRQAEKDPVIAFDLLRQFCLCSRTTLQGEAILNEHLIIVISEADMLLPEGEISRLTMTDRRVIGLCADWFADPLFINGSDAVVLVTESRSSMNTRITRLPELRALEVPFPDECERAHFIEWFIGQQPDARKANLCSSQDQLAKLTCGLSIHALRQLLVGACHLGLTVTPKDVIVRVEEYIRSQLGEDVVEFKRPEHNLDDVIGYAKLKGFLRREFIPRLQSTGPDSLSGAAVCGPIGSGKSFIFEAVAAEADMVVLVLKNIRSQWYGQTDVIFETLRSILDSLSRVLIFVDEADTQFGAVGPDAHETERRLTGKIQAMMSDPKLRGRIKWLLMTARIHYLSPDIRRPGRVGDLIIPVLDPDGDDRKSFIQWMVKRVMDAQLSDADMARLDSLTTGFSSASFASLRSELIGRAAGAKLTIDQIADVAADLIPPAIDETRRLQTLYALINCTRRSLIPDGYMAVAGDLAASKAAWLAEIRNLEARGIR